MHQLGRVSQTNDKGEDLHVLGHLNIVEYWLQNLGKVVKLEANDDFKGLFSGALDEN